MPSSDDPPREQTERGKIEKFLFICVCAYLLCNITNGAANECAIKSHVFNLLKSHFSPSQYNLNPIIFTEILRTLHVTD